MRSSHHCFSRMDTGPKDDQTAEQGEEKLWEQLEVNISFRNHYSYLLLKELKIMIKRYSFQELELGTDGLGLKRAELMEGVEMQLEKREAKHR